MYTTMWNELTWKGYILYDSSSTTSWKRQSYGDSKKNNGCQGGKGRKGWTGKGWRTFRTATVSVWYLTDRHMSAYYTFSQMHRAQIQEWTLIWARGRRWKGAASQRGQSAWMRQRWRASWEMGSWGGGRGGGAGSKQEVTCLPLQPHNCRS